MIPGKAQPVLVLGPGHHPSLGVLFGQPTNPANGLMTPNVALESSFWLLTIANVNPISLSLSLFCLSLSLSLLYVVYINKQIN